MGVSAAGSVSACTTRSSGPSSSTAAAKAAAAAARVSTAACTPTARRPSARSASATAGSCPLGPTTATAAPASVRPQREVAAETGAAPDDQRPTARQQAGRAPRVRRRGLPPAGAGCYADISPDRRGGSVLDEWLGLDQRVVVVAGAGGGGIGTAVCRLVGAAGAQVVAVDRDPARLAVTEAVLDEIGAGVPARRRRRARRGAGRATRCAPCPVRSTAWSTSRAGSPPTNGRRSSPPTPRAFAGIVQLNLQSAFLTSRAVAGRLVAEGSPGSIVHIASIAGLSALPFGAGYAAAKAGLGGARPHDRDRMGSPRHPGERRRAGDRPHAAQPNDREDEDSAATRAVIPLGRRGEPDDIAGAVLSCSPTSRGSCRARSSPSTVDRRSARPTSTTTTCRCSSATQDCGPASAAGER